MQQDAIFLPFLLMMLLTFIVWVYMYARRLPFIFSRKLTPEQLRPEEFTRLQPPAVVNPSYNLKNLFELPVLFYALCLFLYQTGNVTSLLCACAWGFSGFRMLHSLVHCSSNYIPLRFGLYLLSSLCLWAMLLIAFVQQLHT